MFWVFQKKSYSVNNLRSNAKLKDIIIIKVDVGEGR